MVGHFLQPNRRNRSSLSQHSNTSANANGTANISSATSNTGSISSNSGILPAGGPHATHHNHATIDANVAMSTSSSNFGYNVNGGSMNNNANNNVNMNGNHPCHQHLNQHGAMASSSHYPMAHQAASNTTYDVSPSMHYTPPQNLTAEAVAALPPPGPSITASSHRNDAYLLAYFCYDFLCAVHYS